MAVALPYRMQRLLHLAEAKRHAFLVRSIYKTPPLVMADGPVCFVSQLCHRDVAAYLVALKSVYPSLSVGRVCIVDDGSLTGTDKQHLKAHVPLLEIIPVNHARLSGVPVGGAWERFATLISVVEGGEYAVQLDADLLALSHTADVARAVASAQPFILTGLAGGEDAPPTERRSFHATPAFAATHHSNSQHIQSVSERSLNSLEGAGSRHYIRGTAAFVGIPPYRLHHADMRRISQEMEDTLGTLWHAWGSEQVANNMLLAELDDTLILNPPSYFNYKPGAPTDEAKLVHFYGTHRYAGGTYTALSRRFIASLLA